MNRYWPFVLLGVAVVAIVLAGNTLFVVDQRQQAVVLRMGDVNRTINAKGQDDAGLQAKIPFAETVVRFDRQNQAVEVDGQDMRAADGQHLVIDAVLRYRIVDPLAYLKSLGDDMIARARLERFVTGSLRERVSAIKAGDFITGGREDVARLALADVAARVKAAKLGVEVLDLGIKRAGLPAAEEAAIYERMKAQRQQEAAQIRAQGEQDAAAVKATGDKTAAIIIAAAQADAGRIKGEADAKRADLYAESFGRDPQFADFYRSMQAYERTMESGDTTIYLSSDNGFLKYFKAGPGR